MGIKSSKTFSVKPIVSILWRKDSATRTSWPEVVWTTYHLARGSSDFEITIWPESFLLPIPRSSSFASVGAGMGGEISPPSSSCSVSGDAGSVASWGAGMSDVSVSTSTAGVGSPISSSASSFGFFRSSFMV